MPIILLVLFLQAVTAPSSLPAPAIEALVDSLQASRSQAENVWRDRAPIGSDGLVNGYIEIARGDRRKYEFDIAANRMRLDRTMPGSLGGYPVNYGIVPQTVSYDGDPFDVLVLGPGRASGTLVRGVAVGVMRMEDEKGLDSKVVISPVDAHGRPRYQLTEADRERMTRFFNAYKRHEPGKFSRVLGWGSAEEGMAFVRTTHAFFTQCRTATTSCAVTGR
jgi:inorganic pyrophosphatase